MKKTFYLILIFLFIFDCSSIFGQKRVIKRGFYGWFHLTPKAGIGTSWITSGKILDNPDVNPEIINLSYMFGGQLGVSMKDQYDFSLEVNHNFSSQKFDISLPEIDYSKVYQFTCLDFAFLFKYMSNRGYFEIGASLSNLNKISVNNSISNTTLSEPIVFNDNIANFKDNYFNLLAGFGSTIVQVNLFEISIGFRAKYSLSSILNDQSPMIDDNIYSGTIDNSPVHAISLLFEADFHGFIGFFGKAMCGKRKIIFFQKPTTFSY